MAPVGCRATTWILLPVAGGAGERDAVGANGADLGRRRDRAEGDRTAGGALSLETGLGLARPASAAATPITVNGVVFTLATGLPGGIGGRGTPAVLHAYERRDGRRLWSSDKAMTTFASPGSFWSGLGQVYVGAHDGTLYAFGFNDERR